MSPRRTRWGTRPARAKRGCRTARSRAAHGEARVAPGDFVFGDVDGVVIVPRAIAPEAIRLALAKIEAEDSTREELLAGNSLRSVFERHGVL